jgi:hypothetical protein
VPIFTRRKHQLYSVQLQHDAPVDRIRDPCAIRPNAAHYFATFSNASTWGNLHFEKYHCDQKPVFCNEMGGLHQTYVLSGGHSRLVRIVYGSENG